MTAATYQSTMVETKPVSFVRLLRSEWIKFWSLRSTYWALGVTVVATQLMALLMVLSANAVSGLDDAGIPTIDGSVVLASSYYMAQISVAVLGVLVISGEYTTGQIRSSFAAAPNRVSLLGAKATVVAVVSFLLGVVSILIAWAISTPLLNDSVPTAELGDSGVQQIIWGTGLFLAGLALLGFALGAILRHSAGAIAAILGLILLLPIIFQLVSMQLDWVRDLMPYLPAQNGQGAGEAIILHGTSMSDMSSMAGGVEMLGAWEGMAVYAGYIAVLLALAAVLVRRRDA